MLSVNIYILCVCQVRGVKSVSGCSARAVYIWRAPNLIDDANVPWEITSSAIDYANCMKESGNKTAYPHLDNMSVIDIAELKQLCKEIKFDAVRVGRWYVL
jgi:hypothetical protein